jgi:hypothetical protein
MTPALGRQQLFVYWRVRADAQHDALGALKALHLHWIGQWPSLVARRYLRSDDPLQATVMETYAVLASSNPDGLTPDSMARLLAAADAGTAAWRMGNRHTEWFDQLD